MGSSGRCQPDHDEATGRGYWPKPGDNPPPDEGGKEAASHSPRAVAMVDARGEYNPYTCDCDSELCRAWRSLPATNFDRVSRMREVESRLHGGTPETTGLEYQSESVTGGYSWATENATRAVKSLERRDDPSRRGCEEVGKISWQATIFTAIISSILGWAVIALAIRIVEALR